MSNCGLVPGPDGWFFAPEAAAVRPDDGLAVVADVHLGYEWARGRSGETIPAHSLHETLDRLDRLSRRLTLRRLIVAGDLLVDRILDRIYAGWENLDIINWAITWGLPRHRVVDILIQIDVNRARLDYPV